MQVQLLRNSTENQRESIVRNIEEQQEEINGLEQEHEQIERLMTLKDRIKLIFKKYGFTTFAILTAAGMVIGAIINS